MKYLEVEIKGALEQGGLMLRGGAEGIEAKLSNERWSERRDRLAISDLIQ